MAEIGGKDLEAVVEEVLPEVIKILADSVMPEKYYTGRARTFVEIVVTAAIPVIEERYADELEAILTTMQAEVRNTAFYR